MSHYCRRCFHLAFRMTSVKRETREQTRFTMGIEWYTYDHDYIIIVGIFDMSFCICSEPPCAILVTKLIFKKIVNCGGAYRDCIKRNGDKTWM